MANAGAAQAHVSEGGFVLLLPTDIYITAGVLTVAATLALLILVPLQSAPRVFATVPLARFFKVKKALKGIEFATQTVAFGGLWWLIYVGLFGPRDPLANPLPLSIWTLGWMGFVFLQGVFGNLWRWINPWRVPVLLFRAGLGLSPMARLPVALGYWAGIGVFLVCMGFLLADPAPADPARLARFVALYWSVQFVGQLVFGPRWARRVDGVSMALSLLGRAGVFGRSGGRARFGLPGWQLLRNTPMPMGLAVMSLIVLACGIFDGLNETFWWLAQIGINPLAFPGRSAVITPTLLGLTATNVSVVVIFALALWIGLRLRPVGVSLAYTFRLFAPTVLPIAVGYHFAHYFTSFLVEAQYAMAAATDPWATGQDLLGLGTFYVTTGFLNTQDSVQILWLCQAGAVVIGHVLALILAHAVAVRHFASHAALTQLPVAVFMVFCTFIGLWLLASPRGF